MFRSDKITFDTDWNSRVAPAAVFLTCVDVVRFDSLVKAETVVATVTYDVTAQDVIFARSSDVRHRAVQSCVQRRAFCNVAV